jgi:glycosyltransferase involved in cell wall biosynthesis
MPTAAYQTTRLSKEKASDRGCKLRIAEISPVLPPYKGGIGMVCYQNTLTGMEFGHAVDVYTPLYKSLKGQSARRSIVHTIRIFRLSPFFQYGNTAIVPQLLWKLRGYDILHFHYPFIGAALAVLAAKILYPSTKLVVTYHMDLVGKSPLHRFLFSWYSRIIPRFLFRFADRILFSSFDYARHSRIIADLFDRYSDKIVELPFSVNINFFKPQAKDAALLRRYEIAYTEKVLLFVGGLDSAHYFKGVDTLLTAFRILQQQSTQRCHLLVVGEGNLKPFYEQRARELGVAAAVTFAGLVRNADLPSFFQTADVVVLPSVDSSEAFGVVLLEAMASGTAVVTSDLAGPRSIVHNGLNGSVFRPGDPEDLAEKIQKIIEDSSKIKEMGAWGRKFAEERYANNVLGKKLNDLYENLCRNVTP